MDTQTAAKIETVYRSLSAADDYCVKKGLSDSYVEYLKIVIHICRKELDGIIKA